MRVKRRVAPRRVPVVELLDRRDVPTTPPATTVVLGPFIPGHHPAFTSVSPTDATLRGTPTTSTPGQIFGPFVPGQHPVITNPSPSDAVLHGLHPVAPGNAAAEHSTVSLSFLISLFMPKPHHHTIHTHIQIHGHH